MAAIQPWGAAFKRRTKDTGNECIVCGKQVHVPALFAQASPATGQFYAGDPMAAPAEWEVSGYPIGPECAKQVRRDHPGAVIA